jgi:hypothetical protein
MNRTIFDYVRLWLTTGGIQNACAIRIGLAWFLAGALLVSSSAQARIIALFNFNDMNTNNNGTTAVNVDNAIGVPTLSLVEESGLLADLNGQAGIGFTDQDGTVHASGMAAAWTSGVLNSSVDPNDSWLLSVDTTGYRNLMLRFDYRLTSAVFQGDDLQGPTQLTIDWRQGGGAFTPIQTFNLLKDNSYHEFLLDLSGIAAIQNAADVKIRGTWSNDASETIAGGTFPSARIDNLQLTGVPGPATVALFAVGAAAAAIMRPRRRLEQQ